VRAAGAQHAVHDGHVVGLRELGLGGDGAAAGREAVLRGGEARTASLCGWEVDAGEGS
jgi:hypothetical protein